MRRATPDADRDAHGQPADVYVPYANRPVERCSIVPMGGAEVEMSHQIVGITTFKVEMHYREDLTTDSVLYWRSRKVPIYLNVRSVPADEKGTKKRVVFFAVQKEEGV